jgi:hypothetical protein
MTARPKRQPDPRHAEVKALLALHWAAENPALPDLPWGPADAGALGAFLRAAPSLTVEQIEQMLRHRLDSEDHAAGEPAFVWIKYLTRYIHGPLNKYRQPREGGHHGTHADHGTRGNKTDERNRRAVDATAAALARVR